jgi:hypothetical protein
MEYSTVVKKVCLISHRGVCSAHFKTTYSRSCTVLLTEKSNSCRNGIQTLFGWQMLAEPNTRGYSRPSGTVVDAIHGIMPRVRR